MTTQKFNIEDLKNLWRYHENVQQICIEVSNSEFAEIPIVSFVINRGANDFTKNIIPPLNLPEMMVRVIVNATNILVTRVNANQNDSIGIVNAFKHFSNIVELLADNLCN